LRDWSAERRLGHSLGFAKDHGRDLDRGISTITDLHAGQSCFFVRDDLVRRRLTEKIVFAALRILRLLASSPTMGLPLSSKETTEGMRRFPSRVESTSGTPSRTMATSECVVPRSIPTMGADDFFDDAVSIWMAINLMSSKTFLA
jgi:hypothetical protein